MSELYIGLISGTSVDAVDVVVADFQSNQLKLVAAQNHPIPTSIQTQVHGLYANPQVSLQTLGELDAALGHLFAEAAQSLIREYDLNPKEIRAIGSHGQTVWHHPIGENAFTMQLGDPNRICATTGIPTVADFRRKDIALGGQGAPLVPAFHEWLFRSSAENRAILNLGGIANLTILPSNAALPIQGFDTGPSNCLMDRWCMLHRNQAFDTNGDWAATGRVNHSLLQALLTDSYFQTPPPKSTGREYFHMPWLKAQLDQANEHPTAEDVQRTLLMLTCQTIANALTQWAPNSEKLFVCGGGARNQLLMATLKSCLPNIALGSTEQLGLDVDFVEATAFAWLAKQRLEGTAVNLASVTGASRNSVLGALYLPE